MNEWRAEMVPGRNDPRICAEVVQPDGKSIVREVPFYAAEVIVQEHNRAEALQVEVDRLTTICQELEDVEMVPAEHHEQVVARLEGELAAANADKEILKHNVADLVEDQRRLGTPVFTPTPFARVVVQLADIPKWTNLLVAVARVVDHNDLTLPGMEALRRAVYAIINPPRTPKGIVHEIHEIHFHVDEEHPNEPG